MLLLFLLIIALAARPMLPEVLGDVIWPRLLPLRARGRSGLFASWLAYYFVVALAWLLLVAVLILFGLRVTIPAWAGGLAVGYLLLLAAVKTLRNANPSHDWDMWLVAANRLLNRLREEDLDRLRLESSTQDLRAKDLALVQNAVPSSAYLEHLQRLVSVVNQTADIDLTAKDLALDMLSQQSAVVKDALASGSPRRPA
jgi:hypothetical protein